MLLGLFLRFARAVPHLYAVDQHRGVKYGVVRGVLLVVARAEYNLEVVFLAPLDQPALEVGLRLGQFVEVQGLEINSVDQQPVGELLSLVEVNGAYHRFEGIAVDVFLGNARTGVRDDMPIQADFHGQLVERLPRHDLRPQLREEPLVPVGIFDEKVVRGNGLYHGVAQEFEPLVVDRAPVLQNQRS